MTLFLQNTFPTTISHHPPESTINTFLIDFTNIHLKPLPPGHRKNGVKENKIYIRKYNPQPPEKWLKKQVDSVF